MHKLSILLTKIPRVSLNSWCIVLLFAAITATSFVVWLPTRYDPPHWDSAGFLINAVQELAQNRFNPLIVSFSDFAHPPLYPAMLAIVWKLSAANILALHITNLLLLPALCLAVYFLGKKWFSTPVAIGASILTLLTPAVITEYGQIYLDLPAATLILASVAIWHYRRYSWAIFLLCLAVLTKYTVIIALPLFFIGRRRGYNSSPPPYYLLLLPLLLVILYLSYHYLQTGWLLTRPGRYLASPTDVAEFLNNLKFVSANLFIYQGRWLLTLVGISLATLRILSTKANRVLLSIPQVTITISLIAGLFFFSFSGEYAMRYSLFLFPLIYLILLDFLSTSVSPSSRSGPLVYLISTISILIFLYLWHPPTAPTSEYEFRPPSDLTYRDILVVFRQAAAYLDLSHGKANVYGAFPENIYLTQSYQGYVRKPLEFHLCPDFIYNPDQTQILVTHAYSPLQMSCRQLMDHVGLIQLQKFNQGGKWLELFQITATPSAEIQPPED